MFLHLRSISKTAAAVAVLGFALASGVSAQTDNTHALDKPSGPVPGPIAASTFVEKAGKDGLAEVAAGKLAASSASSAEVRAFGQRMVTDHSKANAELKEIATVHKIAVPASMGPDKQAMLDELKGKKGAEFDKAYLQHMSQAHDDAVTLFTQTAGGNEVPPDLKAFANKTLPVLRSHQDEVKKLNAKHM